MGLPLFVAPTEPEVASKATEKTAAVPRSSIRRHRTVRGVNARTQALERRRRLLAMANDQPNSNEFDRSPTPPLVTTASIRDIPIQAQRIAEREDELERDYLRSRINLGRIGRANPEPEDDGPSMMPPVPESRDYYSFRTGELNRLRQRSELQRLARNPAPTPPYTDSDLEFLARGSSDPPRRISPYGHVLAVAHRQATEAEEERSRRMEDSEPRGGVSGRSSLFSNERSTRPTPSDQMGPPVRSRRTLSNIERRRAARQAYSDGLGDRDRSLSPENGAVWDTLLTSITPDPQPPSAGSSFTSAAAAASSSTASGVASTSTSMTSTGPSDDHTPVRDCDVSDSGSNTEEEEEDYGLSSFVRANGAQTWSSYAEAVGAPSDRTSRNDASPYAEDLGGMRSIISRLAERDDIPDDWWASAGLSRNLRREPMS